MRVQESKLGATWQVRGWEDSFPGNLGWMWPCGHDLASGFVAHAHCQSSEGYPGTGIGATASILGILGTRCCPDAPMVTGSSYSGFQPGLGLGHLFPRWRTENVPFVP